MTNHNNTIEMWIIRRAKDANPESRQAGYQLWPITREPLLYNPKKPEAGFCKQVLTIGGKETEFRATFICERYGKRIMPVLDYGVISKVNVTVELVHE